jgi:hypothetical protein
MEDARTIIAASKNEMESLEHLQQLTTLLA